MISMIQELRNLNGAKFLQLTKIQTLKLLYWIEGLEWSSPINPPPPKKWASLVTQLVKNLPAMQESWVQSRGWEDPLKKEKATHSSILAWRILWTV